MASRNILYRFTTAFTCKSRPRGPTNFIRAPGTLDPLTLPVTETTRAGLLTVRAILKAGAARASCGVIVSF